MRFLKNIAAGLFDKPPSVPPPRPAHFLRRSLPRTHQGRARKFFPTASVQDVHILSDAVQALLHLFQHSCRRVRVGVRRTPSGPPLAEGRLDAVLHLLQLQTILPLDRHWCNERPSSSVVAPLGFLSAGRGSGHRAWLVLALVARALSLHGYVARHDERWTELLPLSFAAASGGWDCWLRPRVAHTRCLLRYSFTAASGGWGYCLGVDADPSFPALFVLPRHFRHGT